jgi:hypothetical protein
MRHVGAILDRSQWRIEEVRMRLRWVIPAKWVELDEDGYATITKAGINGIYVWAFPAPARVVLAVNAYGPATAFAEFSV